MAMPLQLGMRAHDFGQIPLPELLEKLQQYHFSYIQFAIKKSFPQSVPSLSSISPSTAAYYGNAFRKAGIGIAVLGCYVNIVDPDPVKRAQALGDFSTYLRLARDFGAGLVGTETGSVGQGYTEENFTEASFQKVVDSIRIMAAEAERSGATIGIEAGLNHPLYTASLTRKLLELIPSNHIQIILDAANLAAPWNYTFHDNVVREAIELLGDKIAVIHLKDFTVRNNQIEIVPVGQGLLRFETILHYIKYKRPHIQAIIEATPEPFLQDSIAYLRNIYDKI